MENGYFSMRNDNDLNFLFFNLLEFLLKQP